MKHQSLTILAALTCFATLEAQAFETHTHAYITYQAYSASLVGGTGTESQALLARLGLDRLAADQPFNPYWLVLPLPLHAYYDNLPDGSAPQSFLRPAGTHEWWQMRALSINNQFGIGNSGVVGTDAAHVLPIANWLMRGVILEDQILPDDYRASDGPLPDPDPREDIRRVYNHFYDPIHDQRLHVAVDCNHYPSGYPLYGYDYCSKSVDWALGTADAFTSISPDPARHNHFTWGDARQNFFLALTATRDADGNGIRTTAERAADAQERLFRWATVFRSLGDVVHLLEDTGQPQHTRNDRHDPHSDPAERQAFEPFTNMRVLGVPAQGQQPQPAGAGENYVYSLTGAQVKNYVTPLPGINDYPKPSFASPPRYYTTRQLGDTAQTSPAGRLGLADYSNRGFFTRGTLPGSNNFDFPPPSVADGTNGYTAADTPCPELPSLNGRAITCRTYFHIVPDLVAPARPDAAGAQPLVSEGLWKGFFGSTKEFTLSPAIFKMQGDLTVPRAIAYSAGLLDYFFRGQLEVLSPTDRAVAVLNQGATHTMNTGGYPCAGSSASDGCAIFGFEKVRVRVRNATPSITESGTGTVVTQKTGGSGAQLVAIARYHRNTCYKPDLSGERVQSYAAPPGLVIAEPTCAAGQTTRTAYQEISVSAPLTVTAGELDVSAGGGVEKLFDFTSDPIPVNATDLFIQVVYRGPMGDAGVDPAFVEPDAIAVGMLDVREPTFVAFWNNTDYFWNGSIWLNHNGTYTNEGVKDFWACTGAPAKWVFHYQGAASFPAMIDPVSGSNAPGIVRLGFVFPPPDFPAQLKSIRGVPVHFSAASGPIIPLRSAFTSGIFRQANKEQITTAALTAPTINCASSLPSASEYWCFDPVQKRRNQLLGTPLQPLYLEPAGSPNPSDVDAAGLPAFAGIVPLASGDVRFNTDATLQNCPNQPTTIATDLQHLREIELLEEARELGVSGEQE